MITDPHQADQIVSDGKADAVLLARALLATVLAASRRKNPRRRHPLARPVWPRKMTFAQ